MKQLARFTKFEPDERIYKTIDPNEKVFPVKEKKIW